MDKGSKQIQFRPRGYRQPLAVDRPPRHGERLGGAPRRRGSNCWWVCARRRSARGSRAGARRRPRVYDAQAVHAEQGWLWARREGNERRRGRPELRQSREEGGPEGEGSVAVRPTEKGCPGWQNTDRARTDGVRQPATRVWWWRRRRKRGGSCWRGRGRRPAVAPEKSFVTRSTIAV